MREIAGLAKAMGDESRLRALCALKNGELCVCQITELLGLAPSTVSKHMSVLSHAGLVDNRKEGRWIYYRLAGKEAPAAARAALAWALGAMGGSAQARKDAKELKRIMAMDPQEICRRQSGCGT